MQVMLEQEEEVRHDVGGDEGAGEDRKKEGPGVGGGAGGDGVADEVGGFLFCNNFFVCKRFFSWDINGVIERK